MPPMDRNELTETQKMRQQCTLRCHILVRNFLVHYLAGLYISGITYRKVWGILQETRVLSFRYFWLFPRGTANFNFTGNLTFGTEYSLQIFISEPSQCNKACRPVFRMTSDFHTSYDGWFQSGNFLLSAYFLTQWNIIITHMQLSNYSPESLLVMILPDEIEDKMLGALLVEAN